MSAVKQQPRRFAQDVADIKEAPRRFAQDVADIKEEEASHVQSAMHRLGESLKTLEVNAQQLEERLVTVLTEEEVQKEESAQGLGGVVRHAADIHSLASTVELVNRMIGSILGRLQL